MRAPTRGAGGEGGSVVRAERERRHRRLRRPQDASCSQGTSRRRRRRSTRPTSASHAAQEQQRQAAANNSLSLAERLLIQANINTTLQFYEQRSQVLRAEQTESEQLLSLAQQVEKTRVLEEGVGVRTDATSRRNAMADRRRCSGSSPGCSPRTCGSRSRRAGRSLRAPNLVGVVEGKTVAVVVPAYNEELLVAETRPRHPRLRRPHRRRRRPLHATGRPSVRGRSATRASR